MGKVKMLMLIVFYAVALFSFFVQSRIGSMVFRYQLLRECGVERGEIARTVQIWRHQMHVENKWKIEMGFNNEG